MKENKGPKYLITIRWSKEDDCYIAEVPELPGCVTDGETEEDALNNARDAIASWMMAAKKMGNPIPKPISEENFSGKFNVRLPLDLHRNLALRARQQKVSLNQLVSQLLASAL